MKKWGKIGSPHSAKRRRHMKRISRFVRRKYKGYGSRRNWKADRKKHGKRPLKRYRRGYGGRGDW